MHINIMYAYKYILYSNKPCAKYTILTKLQKIVQIVIPYLAMAKYILQAQNSKIYLLARYYRPILNMHRKSELNLAMAKYILQARNMHPTFVARYFCRL